MLRPRRKISDALSCVVPPATVPTGRPSSRALSGRLKNGDPTKPHGVLIGNEAYQRYLRKAVDVRDTPAFEIDASKLAEEARYYGIFVLRSNARINALQAMLRYRDLLLQVEALFRVAKAPLDYGIPNFQKKGTL
jgi:hypothetical protein